MNKIHSTRDDIDLNLLRIFEAVYREQHVSRAAASLSLTPSAVSHAIQRLRVRLNDQLFVRDGKRMVPTAQCLQMAPAVLDRLGQLRQLLQQWGSFEPLNARQTFRIGIPDSIEPILLPGIVKILNEHAPGASLESVVCERKGMARALSAGYLDLCFDVALAINEPVRHQPLLEDTLCLVTRLGHPFNTQPTLSQYLNARHVAVSTRAAGAVIEDVALSRLGMQRKVAIRCQNYFSACRIVEQSDCVLVVPKSVAEFIDFAHTLKQWDLPFQLADAQLHMYWHGNREFDPMNLWFRGLMEKCMTAEVLC